MILIFFLWIFFAPFDGVALNNQPIILFYNANSYPYEHCEKVLQQAKLFNPSTPIYYIDKIKAATKHLKRLSSIPIEFIPLESIRKGSLNHFYVNSLHKKPSSRRFLTHDPFAHWFVIDNFINHYRFKNIFYVAMDTLLYADVGKLLPQLTSFYPGLAAVFDDEEKCSHSLLYISDHQALDPLMRLVFKANQNFMAEENLFSSLYHEQGRAAIGMLPILPSSYHRSSQGQNLEKYGITPSAELFQSLFDSWAIGDFLSKSTLSTPASHAGQLHKRSRINPVDFTIKQVLDDQLRKIFVVYYQNRAYRMNTLKVESLAIDSLISF